jgi:hypothetical protein
MQSSVASDLTKPDALTHESVARLIASASDRTNTQLRVTKEGVAFISSTDVGADRIDGLANLQQETTGNRTASRGSAGEQSLLSGALCPTFEQHGVQPDHLSMAVVLGLSCRGRYPGYGARALFKDESIVPVRGQLTRLIPQPEVTYGLGYKDVFVVPRRDGIVLQHQGIGAAQGYNDTATDPDWDEAQRSVSAIAELSASRASPA